MPSNVTSSVYGSPIKSSGGIGGLVSGLDTDTLVEQLTSGTQAKITKQFQAQQKLAYKQEAYRNVISKFIKFSDTYFSYTSKTNLLSPNFFKSNTIKSSNDDVKVSGDVNAIRNFSIKDIASLARNASFTTTQTATDLSFQTGEVFEETEVSTIAGQSISIQYGKNTYTVGIDMDFKSTDVNDVAAHLNEKIGKIDGFKDKVKYEVDADGKLILNNLGSGDVSIVGVGTGIANSLHIALKSDGSSSEAVTEADLHKTSSLKDVLLRGQITFDFNNKQEVIAFSQEDIDSIFTAGATEAEIRTNLNSTVQEKLNTVYGAGRITSEINADGAMSFKTTDSNNILGISSMSYDMRKHFDMSSSTYNRLTKTETLEDSNFARALTADADGNYKIKVNGKEFSFDKEKTINEVINTINKDTEARVTITHSATTDKFTVVSDETGSQAGVLIENGTGSNLADVMFGSGYTIKNGEDATITVSMNGVDETITRSSNNIYFDGINIELSNKASTMVDSGRTDAAGNPIMVHKDITFSVTDNVDEVVKNLTKFVEDYNELIAFLDSETIETPNKDYQPLTAEQKKEMSEDEIKVWEEKAKAGMLFADRDIGNALNNLKYSISGIVEGVDHRMFTIGISGVPYDYTGKLQFNEEKFRQRFAEDSESVVKLFTQDIENGSDDQKGIAVRLKDTLSDNVGVSGEKGILVEIAGTAGTTKTADNYLSKRIDDYDKIITKLKSKLETERARYWKQFTTLETTLNNLNSQSSWLSSQFQ